MILNSTTICLSIPLPFSIFHKNTGHSNRHTPHFLSFQRLPNSPLLPLNSFCFSYRLLRPLHNSFIRSNCARTPSRQSGSIFLYSPVRLRIVLLFSFICSAFSCNRSMVSLCSITLSVKRLICFFCPSTLAVSFLPCFVSCTHLIIDSQEIFSRNYNKIADYHHCIQ